MRHSLIVSLYAKTVAFQFVTHLNKTKIETFSLVILYINISSRKFTIESVCREKTLVRQNVNSQFETERAYNRKKVLPLIEMLQMTMNEDQLHVRPAQS